jgi:hypothetical protein
VADESWGVQVHTPDSLAPPPPPLTQVAQALVSMGSVSEMAGHRMPLPLSSGGCLFVTLHASQCDARRVVPGGMTLPSALAAPRADEALPSFLTHFHPHASAHPCC